MRGDTELILEVIFCQTAVVVIPAVQRAIFKILLYILGWENSFLVKGKSIMMLLIRISVEQKAHEGRGLSVLLYPMPGIK